ncbi:helix-turn-helix domain-containing protein [Paraflavitalea speifideaquila]|uniref:winged helix-turn-helix domain-containing protein n=1 Tax=Paraflavitalea speifideaquila TaxID=3076558 RepID=UPI0028ED1DF7|nr:helix-turn-helix domain-containing protein [Paraflavitalea speifideiaquila]
MNKNRVVSKQSIAEHLWGDHYDMVDNYDTVYVHTMNLRKRSPPIPVPTILKPCMEWVINSCCHETAAPHYPRFLSATIIILLITGVGMYQLLQKRLPMK